MVYVDFAAHTLTGELMEVFSYTVISNNPVMPKKLQQMVV